jgi:hypothetical protein
VTRDGRDVMVSFYHYTTTKRNIEISFDEWLKAYIKGYFGFRWDEHIMSWLGTGYQKLADEIRIVKFENLKRNTKEEMGEILEFFNIQVTSERITTAVESASIEQGRYWEKKYFGEIENQNASFYRGGKTGEWQNYFSLELLSDFMKVSGYAMELAGYI